MSMMISRACSAVEHRATRGVLAARGRVHGSREVRVSQGGGSAVLEIRFGLVM